MENKNRNLELKTIRNEANQRTFNKKEIANSFNYFFANVGKNLASKMKSTCSDKPKKTLNDKIRFSLTTTQEVLQVIRELKSNKAPGLDDIQAEFIKKYSTFLCEPLKHIYNLSIKVGVFPKSLKKAKIKPLYKSGERELVNNYRPISILSSFAKIFEKILKKQISYYLSKHKIISERQYGFQEGRSTQDALSYLSENIYEAVDKSKPVMCVCVDLAKAFDTVNHKEMLDTLDCLGFKDNSLKLMESFFSDREQCVEVGGNLSSFQTVTCGVPQGTVLGPLLFTVYVNSIFDIKTDGDVISFADDMGIVYVGTSWEDVKIRAETDFQKFIDFFLLKSD